MRINTKFNRILLYGLLVGMVLPSCKTSLERIEDYKKNHPETVQAASSMKELKAPEGFKYETSTDKKFEFISKGRSDKETYSNVGMSLFGYNGKAEKVLLAQGATDKNGLWAPTVSIDIDIDSVTLEVVSSVFPSTHRISVKGNDVIKYNLGKFNTNGSSVPVEDSTEETTPETEIQKDKTTLNARSAFFSYMGTYNRAGVPDYLESNYMSVSQYLADFTNLNLKPGGKIGRDYPHFLDPQFEGSVVMKEDGDLYVGFGKSSTGKNNALGYYTYDVNNPPKTVADIQQHMIVFPRAAFADYWEDGLYTGDQVHLGNFKKGTVVSWFIVQYGYRYSGVRTNRRRFYSDPNLNTDVYRNFNQYSVLLADEISKTLVLGFEDNYRYSNRYDFDDVVCFIRPEPWSSVDISNLPEPAKPRSLDSDGDGVVDVEDLYPQDPERAFESFYPSKGQTASVAFEDMWPRKSDYDFNDLIVDYNITEILDANMRVKEMKIKFHTRAIGASQNHGFALRLPIDADRIQSVSGASITDTYFNLAPNGTEIGVSNAVIPIFTDAFSLYGERFGIINTDPEKPELQGGDLNVSVVFTKSLDKSYLGNAPYDPFMIRSKDRSIEVHLPGIPPTEKADQSMFNTFDDRSNAQTQYYYVDENNLPWALNLTESFVYPKEKVPVNEVYTNFIQWATFGGTTNNNWFRNRPENINTNNSY